MHAIWAATRRRRTERFEKRVQRCDLTRGRVRLVRYDRLPQKNASTESSASFGLRHLAETSQDFIERRSELTHHHEKVHEPANDTKLCDGNGFDL
jgi:hypothetical protein